MKANFKTDGVKNIYIFKKFQLDIADVFCDICFYTEGKIYYYTSIP